MGYLFQFIAMTSFGISNCLWGYPLKQMPPSLIIAARATITSLLFFFSILVQYNFHFNFFPTTAFAIVNFNIETVSQATFYCSISYFGLFFFNKSIKYGTVSISIPVLSIGSLIGILTGILFYHEHFSSLKFSITVLFILGLWFIEKLNPQIWKLQFSKGVLFSLLATFFWSAAVFFPLSIKSLGALWFSFILESTVCLMSWTGFLITHKTSALNAKQLIFQNYKWVLILAICGFGGVLFSNLAFFHLPMHIMGMMGIIQPVVSLFVASLLLKEKLKTVQYIGILLILIGMWLAI